MPWPIPADRFVWMWPWVILEIAAVAAVGPLMEEILFRGWLWDRLGQSWSPRIVGIVTCLAFALVHLHTSVFVLPSAIAMTVLRMRTGGLRAPLALHVLHNSLAMGLDLTDWP